MDNHEAVKGMRLASHELPKGPCKDCSLGKSSKKSFLKKITTPRAIQPNVFFHIDACRSMKNKVISVEVPMNQFYRKPPYESQFKSCSYFEVVNILVNISMNTN